MGNSNDERDIAQQLSAFIRPTALPDHPPVPLVADNAPTYRIQVLLPDRPGYIGGSGPPITELQTQPPHKKTGYAIADSVEEERGKRYYVVAAIDDPERRVTVPPEDILKWVSQRTLEDFSYREYERWELEENGRQRTEMAEDELSCDDDGNLIASKSTSKRKRGRPKKRHESEEMDDEAFYAEVLPVKKDRAADRRRDKPDSQADEPPSLSQPSLSQPVLDLKRKISAIFTRDSTPGESTDDLQDEVVEAVRIRNKKLIIRSPPQLVKSATAEGSSNKAAPLVQVPSQSPSRKQSSTPAPLRRVPAQHLMRPPAPAARTGPQMPLFPIFGGRNRAAATSEPPRSTGEILPPEKKRPALPGSSKSFEK